MFCELLQVWFVVLKMCLKYASLLCMCRSRQPRQLCWWWDLQSHLCRKQSSWGFLTEIWIILLLFIALAVCIVPWVCLIVCSCSLLSHFPKEVWGLLCVWLV